MAVNLTKGGNVNLTKAAPGLRQAIVGLGWDVRSTDGATFDLDATAFLLAASGKVRSSADLIFYNNKRSLCGSIEHAGDNQTGDGEGDDEMLRVSLAAIPADVERVAFCVTIHDAEGKRQNFGMVSRAYVRVVDAGNGAEVARYDLSEDASIETAMVFGELYRNQSDWKFRAIGQGFSGGLASLAKSFGVDV